MQSLYRVSAGELQRFLDAPEELLGESEEMQMAIASFCETPRSLLEVLVNSDYSAVVEAARLHVNWVGEESEDYREAVSEVLRDKDLGENDRLAVELMRFAPVPPDLLSEWVPVNKLIQGLKNEYMPLRYRLQLLERLAHEGELEARLQVAESSETPVSLLELLAGDLDLAVRLAVEFNDNCPSELVELVKSQHDLASDWDADIRDLEALGESRWGWVRLAVAENPFAPEDVLIKLARDEEFRIRLAVAKNPGVSADVLAVLAEDSDKQIQTAVVEHPNIGEETLHQLFSDYRNLIQNRNNLPASILERFFEGSSGTPWKYSHTRHLLLNQSNTPTWILSELANVDLEALRADKLVTHSQVESETLEKWILDDIRYLKDIATHSQVSEEILGRLAEYPNPEVKLAVAFNQKTSEALRIRLLEEFINNRDNNIIDVIAENANTPIAILEQIADRLSPFNRMIDTLSQFMSASPENAVYDIEHLLNRVQNFITNYQSQEQILFQLQQNSAFRETILQDWNQFLASLSEEETEYLQGISQFILLSFGMGGGVPYEDREWLGSEWSNHILFGLLMFKNFGFQSDKDHRVIAANLIRNPNTPLSIRENLLNQFIEPPNQNGYFKYENDYDVRMAIAYNPQTPQEQRIEYLQQVLTCGKPNVLETIAKNPLTPIPILEFIAKRGRGGIQDVVKNPNAPVAILRQAAQTDNSYTLRLVAENPNTPKDLLRKLASGHNLTKNPSLSRFDIYKIQLELESERENDEALELLTKPNSNYDAFSPIDTQQTSTLHSLPRIYNPSSDDLATVLTEYAESDNAFVRFVTLLHPVTPGEILTQGANSAFWLERYAVAENQATSLEIRETLARDGNWIVRAAANQRLSNSN